MPWVSIANLIGQQGLTGPPVYTYLNDSFSVPEIGDEITTTVENASWMSLGQMLWVGLENEEAAILQITAKNGNDITLTNPSARDPGLVGPRGPIGPIKVSTDPHNRASLGSDHLIYTRPAESGFQLLDEETTLTEALNGKYLLCSGGAWTLHLPAPNPRLSCYLRNDMGLVAPSGAITLAPVSGQIENQATLPLLAGQECRLFADHQNWYTFGREREVVLGTQRITAPVANTSVLLPEGYTQFDLSISQLQGQTTTPALYGRISTDHGVTFSAANYYCLLTYNNTASTLHTSQLNNSTIWYITHWVEQVPRHLITMKLFPGAADSNPMYLAQSTMWQGFTGLFWHGGFYNANVRINALQFHLSAGNIARMSVTVKGIV